MARLKYATAFGCPIVRVAYQTGLAHCNTGLLCFTIIHISDITHDPVVKLQLVRAFLRNHQRSFALNVTEMQ